jgi:aquaporin Z
VINHYAGGNPISRTAAVIAPGAVVMAMIYAWGPLSGLHINPAVTLGFTARGVFPRAWVVPYWVVQLGGAVGLTRRIRQVPDRRVRGVGTP